MWEDTTTAPAPVSSGSLSDLFSRTIGAIGSRVEQEIQRDNARQTTGDKTDPALGVNEMGTPFLAGVPTFLQSSVAGVPAPLVLAGVGILAVVLLLRASR